MPSQRAKKSIAQQHMDAISKQHEQRIRETIQWISTSDQLPDADEEVLVCYERTDNYERDVTQATYDDSLLDDGESPWVVDGGEFAFGTVMYWARKPMGPKRS